MKELESSIVAALRGVSIAVISNSDALLGSGFGKEIDSHDHVIRFNKYSTERYEKDVGTKTTGYCCHFEQSKTRTGIAGVTYCFVCCNCDEAPPSNLKEVTGIDRAILLRRNYLTGRIKSTTGMTLIRWLVEKTQPLKLNLYGFSGVFGSHYFAVKDKMSGHHDIKMEAGIIQDFAKSNQHIELH